MLIGELINNLALKAGVLADNDELKALLTAPELANVNVPDDLVSTIDKGIVGMEAAMNNHPTIKAKYQAGFLDGVDKALYRSIEDAGFTAEELAEIKASDKTATRIETIIAKLKAAKGKTGADKDGLNAKIEQLNNELRLEKEAKQRIIDETDNKIKDIGLKSTIKSVLSNYKTIYDEIPGDTGGTIRATTLEAIVQKSLQDKQARLTIDEQGNLQLIGNDGSNVFSSGNVKLTPTSFLDQSLAPILKVSNNSAPKPGAAPPTRLPTATATTPAEAHAEANSAFVKSHADQVLADMGTAPVSMV